MTTSDALQQELVLRQILGPALMAAKGFAAPEVEQTYTRARELCQQIGETQSYFPSYGGCGRITPSTADLPTAQSLAAQLLALAQQSQEAAPLMQAHRALGQTFFWQGSFVNARYHLEQSLTFEEPHQHGALSVLYGQDSGLYAASLSAEALALLGMVDQAWQHQREAVRLARERAHPLSLAIILTHATRMASVAASL